MLPYGCVGMPFRYRLRDPLSEFAHIIIANINTDKLAAEAPGSYAGRPEPHERIKTHASFR